MSEISVSIDRTKGTSNYNTTTATTVTTITTTTTYGNDKNNCNHKRRIYLFIYCV